MASSMHIYSIPECLTDEELSENEIKSGSARKLFKKFNLKSLSKRKSNLRSVSRSYNDIDHISIEYSRKSRHQERKIKSQVSTSLIDISDLHRSPDYEKSKKDKSVFFTQEIPFTKSEEKISSNPYQEIEDYNLQDESQYEPLLVKYHNQPSISTSPQRPCLKPSTKFDTADSGGGSHYETLLVQPLQTSNTLISKEVSSDIQADTSPKPDSSTTIRLDSKEDQSTGGIETQLRQNYSRGRSGSVQWIQNIFQNIDKKCRSFLDLRRPSDIAEEGMRNSNEKLEAMEHSEEDSSKSGFHSTASSTGGRRYSENVIGKQNRRFPAFSNGFGHLKVLWKDRSNESKKQDLKDNDQLRPDVCPLFSFPRKSIDEDEMILDALRQAMRKCTIVDPSARPPSSSVFEQLSQITIK
ncbi:hypothetical protein JTE90_009326 [Oedothorax gibbosus]|uniref:Uncharacterized protein n=1 Tax=Oedothorax gibbosus TaxID=931172 RepID=A0AAV6VTW9_9ARAC|nr:hypothetical protein JTE90_009326 [Oedothorax gibbosus]